MFKFILLLFLVACSTLPKNAGMTVSTFYQRDMVLTVNGLTGIGTLVVPKSAAYNFDVKTAGPLDMFTMKTCSKEESKQNAGNVTQTVHSGLFGWGTKQITIPNEVTFLYTQTDLESDGGCTMELTGLDKTGGENSWAFIDFESDRFALPASVECNGITYRSNGTTVCQSRQGLMQKITFDEPAQPARNNPCGIPFGDDKKDYEFTLPVGRCEVIFYTHDKSKKHKLTINFNLDIL